jgi:hypothetical protein
VAMTDQREKERVPCSAGSGAGHVQRVMQRMFTHHRGFEWHGPCQAAISASLSRSVVDG